MDSDIKQLRPHVAPTANANGRARGPENSSPNSAHNRDAERTAPATDTVTVTGEAARLQQLEQSITDSPAVDSKRVEALRQAIANGNYQPNAERIADKLAQLEKDLV